MKAVNFLEPNRIVEENYDLVGKVTGYIMKRYGWREDEVESAVGPRLHISEETVKSHMRHIIAKLRARNRTHAVAIIAMNRPELLR